jgi:DNA primase
MSTAPIMDAAASYYREQLAGSWVPRYLTDRGLAVARRYRWATGTAPGEWTALVDHLRILGWAEPAIVDAGLATLTKRGRLIDRFRDRVMLPIRTPDGDIIGFIGRTTNPDAPRWLNSPASTSYDKSAVLYGIYEARASLRNGATVALVEGPFDAIAVTEAGRGSVVGIATCGTALTPAHAELVAAHAVGPVVVAFDTDKAGRAATSRSWEVLHNAGITATNVALADGDAADTLHNQGPAALVAALTDAGQPLIQAALAAAIEPWEGYFHEPECRVAAMRATLPILAKLDTENAAEHTLLVAAALGINPAALTDSDAWLGMLATALNARSTTPTRTQPPTKPASVRLV